MLEIMLNLGVTVFPDPGNSYHLDGLLPKTLYLIRAKAKNLAGLSDSSNVIVLQTNSPHQVGELLGNTASKAVASTKQRRRSAVILIQSAASVLLAGLVSSVLISS